MPTHGQTDRHIFNYQNRDSVLLTENFHLKYSVPSTMFPLFLCFCCAVDILYYQNLLRVECWRPDRWSLLLPPCRLGEGRDSSWPQNTVALRCTTGKLDFPACIGWNVYAFAYQHLPEGSFVWKGKHRFELLLIRSCPVVPL